MLIRITIKKSSSLPKVSAEFEAIAHTLHGAHRGIELSQMFGMPCIKNNGKAFAGLWGSYIVCKLSGVNHASALALSGSKLFDPSGMHRPMKQWVQISHVHVKQWPKYARNALKEIEK